MITDLAENEISKAPLIVSWPKWHRIACPVGKILDSIMNSWRCSKRKREKRRKREKGKKRKRTSFSTETLQF